MTFVFEVKEREKMFVLVGPFVSLHVSNLDLLRKAGKFLQTLRN
jgi:hypothetical protein